ncbi:MFS transporter [Actinomadura opuntiae]|uniref:MFS transporter n=1 Tax=Actinomadura sp. OS1-43 TaxID=604315 RepID=UPI00255AE308|nr:MFS transporter [Actinomadura sp. OS1-43]MDL4814083.1 MFS transporter [Actinomadura sp. OS1-43]
MTQVIRTPVDASDGLRLSQPAGRWVVVATALGAGLVLLETTVLNVALPPMARDLGAGMAGMQWTVNAFALALTGLILFGAALGDRYGRRRIYLAGLALFATGSLLGGFAPGIGWLITARAVQGVGGALLVPGSLALIQAAFHPGDRARAVGAWSGMSGVAGAAGPLLGGVVVDAAGWRWVFWINVPIAAVVASLVARHVPDAGGTAERGRLDVAGAVLAAIGFGGLTYGLTDAAGGPPAAAAAAIGLLGMAAFVLVERRAAAPMLPLELFAVREFSAANLASFCLYGAVAGMFFLLPMQLQITAGYSPLATGLALLPITAVVLVLSPRTGTLVARAGPRVLLTAGSVTCAAAALLAVRIGADASYLAEVLPVVLGAGLGISAITAPISVTVLSAVAGDRAGIASGVNNGVARAAGLLVVAVLPPLANLPQDATHNPEALDRGFDVGMVACAGLYLLGAAVAWWGTGRIRPAAESGRRP